MSDTYPIFIKNPKQFNFKDWLYVAIIIILAILLFKQCNKKPLPSTPTVTSVEKQKEVIRVDSIASKKYTDSVNRLVKCWEAKAKQSIAETEALQDINLGLQQDMNEYIQNTSIPDTCLPFKNAVADLNKKLYKSIEAAQAASNKAVAAQRQIITQKDVLIEKGKTDIARLKVNIDSCFAQQQKLQKAINNTKNKGYVLAGIMAQSTYIQPYKLEAGVFLGYTSKRKMSFSIGVTTQQRGFITLSTKLF